MRRVLLVFALLVGVSAVRPASVPAQQSAPGTDAAPAATPSVDQGKLEQEFAEQMSGATLAGRFTMGSLKPDAEAKSPQRPLKEDRYTLGKVEKLKGDTWLIETRIQYGDHDLTVPLMLQVKWAGDTPVITLTDLTIPGLGTFTSRVLVYRGQYAGTWQHGDRGGELFGKIEPAKK